MKPKILIVNHSLRLGGGEKLVFELVTFAKKNNIDPSILILDNYAFEHYDLVYKELNVPVIRTRLSGIFKLRDPVKIIRALYWKFKLKFFSFEFKSIHVINLSIANKVRPVLNTKKRLYIWHVVNSIQFAEHKLPAFPELLNNEINTILFINKYQESEIERQFGMTKAKKILFKIFLN